MSALQLTPLDAAAAIAVAAWRYPPPYAVYNLDNPLTASIFLRQRDRGYYQLRDQADELVAFCCYGEEARVPGGDYSAPALDLGLGLRPDLTGQGQGRRFLEAILAFGRERFAPQTLRLTVAGFNRRAIRLYTAAGFREAARFSSTFGGQAYIIMTQSAARP